MTTAVDLEFVLKDAIKALYFVCFESEQKKST